MIEIEMIKDKLVKLTQFLRELEEVKPTGSLQEYRSNTAAKRSCERLIQLIVESAADINSQVIIALGKTPPKDYYDTFVKAGSVGLLPDAFSKRLASWAGLRNRLVHEYQDIKDKLIFEKISPTIENFSRYIQEVQKFIEKRC